MSVAALVADPGAAPAPPEARALGREDVAMLVARRGDSALVHARFPELPRFLHAGDLLVVNTSATIPAALPARLEQRAVELRLSTKLTDTRWVVELRTGPPSAPAASDRRPAEAARWSAGGAAGALSRQRSPVRRAARTRWAA